MDKFPNRFNKGRNKMNQNQPFNPNNLHGKKTNKMFSMMNYENNQFPPFYPTEDYTMGQPHPFPNMYQIPPQGSSNKEQNIKNMFKFYQKKNNMQYNQGNAPNDLMNMGDNEMSLEDNPQFGNKKFNNNKSWKQGRNQRKRKNIYQFNKDSIINANQYNNMLEPISSRAISSENSLGTNQKIPEAYYNTDLEYNNNFTQKGGKKKAQTYEYRNRKRPYMHPKQKYDDYQNPNFNTNNQNIKTITNQQKHSYNISDIEEDSIINYRDNDYVKEEEEEIEEEEAEADAEEDDNSQDIKIIEDSKDNNTNNDDTHKEVIDISKIKLIEKKEKTDNAIDIKSSEDKVNKVKIIPELTEMCSEKEIIEREKNKDLDVVEIDPDSFPGRRCIKERMVQKYRRKGGKILKLDDPKEIRNISAINKSINFLIGQILDCDNNKGRKFEERDHFTITLKDIIDFIFDRFIAIYKTIDILKDNDNSDNLFNDCQVVENICRMIRTGIIFLNICYDEFVDDPTQEVNILIDELLLPLLEYVKEIINNESKYQINLSEKNRDEFLSYYLFLKLKKDRKNFGKIFQEIISKIKYTHEKIDLVHEIFIILNRKNFEKFMEILKGERCDYLTGCLMSLFFKEICVEGLIKLSLKSKKVQYRQILDIFTFENIDEIKNFLVWYGITVNKLVPNENDTVNLSVHNKNKNFNYDKAPQKTNRRIIEKKRGDNLRKDMVSQKVEFKKNEKYIKKDTTKIAENDKKNEIKNISLVKSEIVTEKNNQNSDYNDTSSLNQNNVKKDILNIPSNESFISKGSYNKLFDIPPNKQNQTIISNSSINKSDKKTSNQKISKDIFPKPMTPKKIFSDTDKGNMNKSFDAFSQISISSIEGNYKNYPYFNEQTLEFFCEVSSSIINKIISDLKFDFIYRLKFIVEKYKIKLELIENYIDRRKFFAFHELKIKCLNEKYSKQYYKELINYNNNLNSENTNENVAFKINDKNLLNNKKFELLTYEDIIYFLIKDQEKFVQQNEDENIKLINHLQINIYTTKDLIKSTRIISSLKLKKSMLKENSDGSELTIIDNNININSNNKLSLIIKFIFVDQIIDLDSYIYDNRNNISKYAILIPFFDIIKSDPESQQILTKFFTILDLGLGSFIKKDIIFFFIKRDIEQTSDLYKDYQNIQNDFIFNLMQKYSNNTNKNSIIYIDDDYDNNEKVKEKIIYLSPIDEFGKCYQEYIKYLNNKTFVELFENNKQFHLNVFNPKEVLIPFEKHIYDLDILINHYLAIIEKDLQKYLEENNCINYFYNNKLCIEVLIGFIMCKILLTYYQYISLSFANELFKVPYCNSTNDLLILEDNLLNAGSIFRKINIDGYDYIWKQCFSIDTQKKKNIFSYFDIFSELICQYNLISDIDIQNYEYCFRKQYYDFNLEKKNYEIAKNFVNFFNKIIIKFVSNNNLNIKNSKNTAEIFEKIYKKNKIFLLKNISKIITNNSICFTESIIYMNGIGDVYHGVEKVEILEYNKNLSKKRKRNIPLMDMALLESKKKNNLKLNNKANKNMKVIKELNENFQIVNNVMDINESKSINKSKASFIYETGDINDDYYKAFRKVRKYNFQNSP